MKGDRPLPAGGKLRFLVVTAFDTRYEVGYLCSTVNEAYCRRHGYSFWPVLLTPEGMVQLAGGRHCAWGKVALLHHLNDRTAAEKAAADGIDAGAFDYVVWIDADALVLAHDTQLEHFVASAQGADLIIGEDMADTDLVNTGLLT
ncbi:unnamed protein product [Polarella glacialis]|uniref:Ceramide glucosyltransferase n=1 Tax=Polarella glacialis TaxID=89957 RepID=A0A813GBE1_POLGL|nr:unnamed protein product [Polarella glacialis]